jgi:hypothetical protein
MANQEIIRASPNEGFSIARQAMDDAVDFYLKNGGPAVARTYIESLANSLKFYDDCAEAYRHAMERIKLAEEAERQQEETRNMQQMQQMMMKVIMTVNPKHEDKPTAKNNQKTVQPVALPPKLSAEKAMKMWRILMKEGMIDEHYQPVGLSRTEMALLAEEMTICLADENDNLLDIKEWKPYETLWHRKNMKADLQRALKQDKTQEFRDKLKRILEGNAPR